MSGEKTMTDILSLGEVLIDLTQTGTDELGNGQFTAYPGGAPANVAVAAARLGARTGFIGKVGDDAFGRFLTETLKTEDVDVSGLFVCKDVPTTLALVSVDEDGERSFAFYRDPGADTRLTSEEALSVLGKRPLPKILHIGSLSLTAEPSRSACLDAVRYAKEQEMLVSYDPNYRAPLWDSETQAVGEMRRLLPFSDILKVSEEELYLLTGTKDCEKGSLLLSGTGPALVLVTLGGKGVFLRCGEDTAALPGISVVVADTNGAGDTFLGAMLTQIARKNCRPEEIPREDLRDMTAYANRAAALTCTRHGAIPAMPYAEELR